MTFHHKDFTNTLDRFAKECNNSIFTESWRYTKKIVRAHARATDQSLSSAWKQFEHTVDRDEDLGVVALAGVVDNLIASVPGGSGLKFIMYLEIGLNRARGYSWDESEKYVYDHYKEILKEKAEEVRRETGLPTLRLVKDD